MSAFMPKTACEHTQRLQKEKEKVSCLFVIGNFPLLRLVFAVFISSSSTSDHDFFLPLSAFINLSLIDLLHKGSLGLRDRSALLW